MKKIVFLLLLMLTALGAAAQDRKITGTLTNNTDKEKSYIQIEYVLYDADGNQVGTALANTNHLKAGGSWKFEALGTVPPDQVASWERSDVSGF